MKGKFITTQILIVCAGNKPATNKSKNTENKIVRKESQSMVYLKAGVETFEPGLNNMQAA